MDSVYEEQKPTGIVYPFSSHIQKASHSTVMAKAHIHDYIEILYCLDGYLEIYLNWEKYDFNKGDMIIINSKEIHKIVGMAEINKYIVVKFEPELLYATSQPIFEAKYVLPFTMSKSTHQKLFTNNEISDTIIPVLLKEIYSEYEMREYGFELAIRANICRLFLWILRGWNAKGLDLNISYSLSGIAIERLHKIFDYVAQNYHNDINVFQMAQLCNMSYSYFSRFFKAVMKKSFKEYLNFVRITAAEKLLINSDLNITEIAQEVGFSTSSYFISQFKNYKSVSPKQFRNKFCS